MLGSTANQVSQARQVCILTQLERGDNGEVFRCWVFRWGCPVYRHTESSDEVSSRQLATVELHEARCFAAAQHGTGGGLIGDVGNQLSGRDTVT